MGQPRKKGGGIDVHLSLLVAAIAENGDEIKYNVKEFTNDACGQIELAKWYKRNKVSVVGMESTGPYWKALYYTLKQFGLKAIVSNGQMVKKVPGNKTDKIDSKWLAKLTLLGLMPESNIPDLDMMDYRSLVRSRSNYVKMKTAIKNQISGLIAEIGLRLKASDKFGKGCREILINLAEGKNLAEIFSPSNCRKFRLDAKKGLELVSNLFTPTKRRILSELLGSLNRLEKEIESLESAIQDANMNPDRVKMIEVLRSLPGIDWVAASIILAEIGNIEAFPSATKLSSYAGLVPTSNQSGEKIVEGHVEKKKRDGRPNKRCNHRLKWIMLLCAETVTNFRENDLNKHLKRFHKKVLSGHKNRFGKMAARFALAHKMIKIIWTLLTTKEMYRGPEGQTKTVKPIVRKYPEESMETNDGFAEVLANISTALSKKHGPMEPTGEPS